MRAHRLHHRAAARLQLDPGALHAGLEVAGPAVRREPGLGDHAGRDVGVLRVRADRRGELLGAGDVADPQARGHRLRERRHGQHAAVPVELEERRMRIPGPAQQTVGIVLDHDDVVLGGELQHAPAPLERHRGAARVLEVRDHVDERRRLALQFGGQRVGVDPVGVDRDADHLGSGALQDQDAAVVRRRLHEHAARRGARQQHAGDEGERLERAIGADDLRAGHAMALADPLAQSGVPAGVIRERDCGLPFHRIRERAPEVVDGQHVGARDAARERDRIGHAGSLRGSVRASVRRRAHVLRTPGGAWGVQAPSTWRRAATEASPGAGAT